MRHKDSMVELQMADDRIKVSLLVLCCISISGRFVRRSPPEKIKSDNAARRCKKGSQAIIKMKIVGEAMHEDGRRFRARIFPRVDLVSIARHAVFRKIHS